MAKSGTEWRSIDTWWDRYVYEQEKDLAELRELFLELDGEWERSKCLFDHDPLAEDWTQRDPESGPLRAQEENWSQWLAHLVRSSSGGFNQKLFGTDFEDSLIEVRREREYRDAELGTRRVDIIIELINQGISIEVKVDDEEYEKTLETAYLTEAHHHRDLEWTHFLLLPRSKRTTLIESFDSKVDDQADGALMIDSDEGTEVSVSVMYWYEVSQALRQVLLADTETNHHWVASAYLLVSLVEQKILDFYPLPSLDESISGSIGVSDVERLRSINPDEQINYLRHVLGANHE